MCFLHIFQGKLVYINGDCHKGEYKNGQRDGFGKKNKHNR